jgi:RimJ/RimL family protein N-acetyltransferase
VKYYKKFIGKHIYLSPINPDDVEIYTKWINDLHISVPLGNASDVFSIEAEREILEKLSKEKYNFAIVELKNDRLLGNCSLFDVNLMHQRAELGIFIGEKENWGKGFGTEAIILILEFGFKILNLHNIMLKVFSFNERAIKVYKKIGFEEIGIRKEACRINNKWFDDIHFQILSSNFNSNLLNDFLPD